MTKPEHIYPENMPLRQSPKRETKMRQIVRQLQITPIPQIACERAGISRATYYRWRANDVVFSRAADHAIEESRFFVNDLAESQLIRKIKNEDLSSIKFWLSHNHPKYSKKEIHDHCQICETRSIEEKHREMRRDIRNLEVVNRGIAKNLTGEIDDRHEQAAHKAEDWMFERFEMLNDETDDDKSGGSLHEETVKNN